MIKYFFYILIIINCSCQGQKNNNTPKVQDSKMVIENDKLLSKNLLATWQLDAIKITFQGNNQLFITDTNSNTCEGEWNIEAGNLSIKNLSVDCKILGSLTEPSYAILFVSSNRLELLDESSHKSIIANKVKK